MPALDWTNLGDFVGLLWRNAELALFNQVLNEMRNVPSGNGNVFDATANHVSLGHWNHVSHPVATVHYCAGQTPVALWSSCPRRGQSKHGLDGDIHTFKNDLIG